MARLVLSARAFADLERIFEFVAVSHPDRAIETVHRIRDGVLILEQHPMMGRQVEDGRRELVMGRGVEAYLALYRWMPAMNVVLVLAVRNAREAGYQGA
jgi:plasmid stabilization system protein ParE